MHYSIPTGALFLVYSFRSSVCLRSFVVVDKMRNTKQKIRPVLYFVFCRPLETILPLTYFHLRFPIPYIPIPSFPSQLCSYYSLVCPLHCFFFHPPFLPPYLHPSIYLSHSIPYLIIPSHTASRYTTSPHYPVLCYPISPDPIPSYPIQSYPTIGYAVTSHAIFFLPPPFTPSPSSTPSISPLTLSLPFPYSSISP